MNKNNVVLSSDFFLNEVNGGAEFYVEELFNSLSKTHNVVRIKSQNLTTEFVDNHKGYFFIVSNFVFLTDTVKQHFINSGVRYCILEHNPAWDKKDNPLLYPKSIVSESQIRYLDFYRNAQAVLCQSKLHAELTRNNLLLNNVINLGCNLWSDESLNYLEQNLDKDKTRKVGVIQSQNKNKGYLQAVEYCRKNNIAFDAIQPMNQKNFFSALAETETLVFFPQWFETFCRLAVEARILGCKLISNKALGCASEDFFKLQGRELLEEVRKKKNNILDVYERLISGKNVNFSFESHKLPKVTLISTFYDAKNYIEGFLRALANQTVTSNEEVEFIFIDANSPTAEFEEECVKIFAIGRNVTYQKNSDRITTAEAFNRAVEISKGEFITFVCVDDSPAKDHLETLRKHLYLDPDVDLVYGDCLQTNSPNETVEKNSSKGRIYEHSRNNFSPENMIRCLPGPMPMFRKSMFEKHSGFKNNLKFASDWEFWLRCVRGGSRFKKVDKIVGLYYYNTNGLSTSNSNFLLRLKEESSVFNEYKDVVGEKNYNLYKGYFGQVTV